MYKKQVLKKDLEELFEAILSLENKEECQAFFDDLCTIAEIKSLAQRWSVVKILAGGATYARAMEDTDASSATVSRIKKCLDYGSGGYQLVLKKLEKKD